MLEGEVAEEGGQGWRLESETSMVLFEIRDCMGWLAVSWPSCSIGDVVS